MLGIQVPPSIQKRLEELARCTRQTKSYYVREAILQHLDDLEAVCLRERALKRIREGEESTIPLEDLMNRYGLVE